MARPNERASSNEALAWVRGGERFDVVLLDLFMPELDGIGVVRMLKKSEMPLIAFVTAYVFYQLNHGQGMDQVTAQRHGVAGGRDRRRATRV